MGIGEMSWRPLGDDSFESGNARTNQPTWARKRETNVIGLCSRKSRDLKNSGLEGHGWCETE
ncbi:hypothetical protein RRSWK_02751 [Rhodopirellula sp. SWK7]|nr:hypothetical protein RRSWK_02751 [Rhodopirellula sp. SWK7]